MNVTTPLFGDMSVACQFRDICILYKRVSDDEARKKWDDILQRDESGEVTKGRRTVIVLSGSILPVIQLLFQSSILGNAPHLIRVKTKEKKNDTVVDVSVMGVRVTGEQKWIGYNV